MNITILTVGPRGDVQPTWPWLAGSAGPGEQLGWQPFRRHFNHWRRQRLGLAPVGLLGPGRYQRRRRQPVLYGYSSSVVPRPRDWGSHLHVTGYWFPDPDPAWQPRPPSPGSSGLACRRCMSALAA